MSEVLKSLSNEKSDTIIMGGFNINMFIDNNRISSSFEDIMICNGFTPTILVATHIKQAVYVRASTISLLTSLVMFMQVASLIPKFLITGHCSLTISCQQLITSHVNRVELILTELNMTSVLRI